MPRYLRHQRHRRYMRYDRHDPVTTVTAVGALQYSADGSTGWAALPAGTMKVNTDLDFYIRADPAGVTPTDDGSFDYQFKLIADNSIGGPGHETDGIGGLTLTNDPVVQNKAHITGKAPADQVGLKFTANVTVVDRKGTAIHGTAMTQVWS